MCSWNTLKDDVNYLIKSGSTMFSRIRSTLRTLPSAGTNHGKVWFNPRHQKLYFSVSGADSTDLIDDWSDALQQIKGVKQVVSAVETPPPKDTGPWILVKQSSLTLGDIFKPVGQVSGWTKGPVASLFGGPNTASAAIASGALGAGLGYGAGTFIENLFPDQYVEKGKLRKNLGLLGAGLGVAPALWAGYRGWFNKTSSFDESRLIGNLSSHLNAYTQTIPDQIETSKLAEAFFNSGANYVKAVEKDSFNRAIWGDPYTSVAVKGITSGVVEGADQVGGGSGWISPMDIARLGVGMGSGYASGLIVGKTLGALAGVSDEAQKSLQRAGVWSGLIKNMVPMLFN